MGRRGNDINEQGRGSVLKEKQKILGLVNLVEDLGQLFAAKSRPRLRDEF